MFFKMKGWGLLFEVLDFENIIHVCGKGSRRGAGRKNGIGGSSATNRPPLSGPQSTTIQPLFQTVSTEGMALSAGMMKRVFVDAIDIFKRGMKPRSTKGCATISARSTDSERQCPDSGCNRL
mgnify:CR=1 FL=1